MDSSAFIPGTRIEFITVCATMGLYGITCMQTFLYFAHYKGMDRWPIKLLVICLWCFDTTHQVLTNRGFWVLISRSHNPFILSREYLWGGFFTSFVTLLTQTFFVVRIWNFGKKHWIIPLVFVPCTLFQFVGYIAFLIICWNGGPTAATITAIEKLPMAFWGVQCAEDILISGVLIVLVWKHRMPGGFKSTDRILYRLTVFVINTGVWTALCSLLTIIFLAVQPNFQTYLCLSLVICPLYCNMLLANLNARGFIRGATFSEPERSTTRGQTIIMSEFRATKPELAGSAMDSVSTHSVHSVVRDLSTPTFANNSNLKLSEMETGSLGCYV